MNMSLYGFGGSWLMVDCGITFGDDRTPGVDIMVPDIRFLEEIGDDQGTAWSMRPPPIGVMVAP